MQEPFEAPTGEPASLPRSVSVERWVLAVVMAALCLITMGNVVVRYLTNVSFAFTEEFSVFLMVLVALVGGSSVMAKNGHLRISFLVEKLSPERRRAIGLAANILTTLMFLLLTIFGTRMAWDEYRYEVTSPGLGIPTWLYTMWLPVLALAICGRALGLTIRTWRRDG